VKLRGFRIEPEEIEAQLALHPAVRDSAVIVSGGDDPASARLVAYLVLREDRALSAEEARDYSKSVLPEHMVPAAIVMLEDMPLGPNGKRDLDALPPPPERSAEFGFVAPRTPLEEALAFIFAEVLKVDRIGVDDNFFEHGGDSLSAAQVAARIRQLLDLDVPLPLLFEVQSVADLAEEILAMLEESGSDLQPA
jgi:acyl carrier protein